MLIEIENLIVVTNNIMIGRRMNDYTFFVKKMFIIISLLILFQVKLFSQNNLSTDYNLEGKALISYLGRFSYYKGINHLVPYFF